MCDHKFRPTATAMTDEQDIPLFDSFGNQIGGTGWYCPRCKMVSPPCFYPKSNDIVDIGWLN
jgi:hypothetical protein